MMCLKIIILHTNHIR